MGLSSDNLSTAYTKGSLTTGEMHKFRYLVKNDVGWSGASPIMTTYAAVEPAQIIGATTQIDPVDPTLALLEWSAPSYDGGLGIIAYQIKIGTSDGTYHELLSTCDGALPAIRDAYECNVALTDLQAAPFTLEQGNKIQITVTATSLVGSSDPSIPNTSAALLERAPHQPPVAPTKNSATT